MKTWHLTVGELPDAARRLHAGDRVYLSGDIYTARDAAHLRMDRMLDAGETLPIPLGGAVIYYAGATPTPPGRICGAIGPTTSGRMDPFAPRLYRAGLAATIGKGPRSRAVAQAIAQTGGVYLVAVGGAGALAAKAVTALREVAFPDLGCESIKQLTIADFSLIVGIDCKAKTVFPENN